MAGEVNDIPTKRVAGKNTLQEDGQAPAGWSPSGHYPISPREGITRQESGEVTTTGWTVAGRPPGEVVTEEYPIMPTLVPQDGDEEEVEQGRPAHTRKPPVGMTP